MLGLFPLGRLFSTGASLVAVGGLTSCDAQASLVVGSLVAAHRLSCPEVVLVAQSCPTLCDPMDCSPPGSSVYGISQARILKWVDISFSRGSSGPKGQPEGSI